MKKWNPAEHLPECGITRYPICICDRLRACEQRVTERWEELRGWGESFAYKTGSDNGFDAGYRAGLDAARDAVARTCGHTKYEGCRPCAHDDAVAAIDALRGEA